MRSLGLSANSAEVSKMVSSVDADGSGCIEWPEFLFLMSKKVIDAENQHKLAFEFFDRHNRGRVSKQEFIETMQKLSDEFTVQDLTEMVSQAKFEDDDHSSLTYREFVKM